MKTTFEKNFDAIKYMREQTPQLSEKLSKMTKKEMLNILRVKNLRAL